MRFLMFSSGKQREFILQAKKVSAKTWDELAAETGKSRGMLSRYLREQSRLNEKVYLTLSKYARSDRILTVVEIYNTPQNCSLPASMSNELAEVLGVLAGDGNLDPGTYGITIITSRIVDLEYADYLNALLTSVFGIRPHSRDERNTRRVYLYSKDIQKYLVKTYDIPLGKKKGRLHIPSAVLDGFILPYLRGLFDTDGSFYERGHGRGVVNISSKDQPHMAEVASQLRKLDYHVVVSGKNLFIYRLHDIERFFLEIRPANPKHLKRYQRFLQRRDAGRQL